MTKKKLIDTLSLKTGYIRWSDKRVANRFKVSENIARKAKTEVKIKLNNLFVGF